MNGTLETAEQARISANGGWPSSKPGVGRGHWHHSGCKVHSHSLRTAAYLSRAGQPSEMDGVTIVAAQ